MTKTWHFKPVVKIDEYNLFVSCQIWTQLLNWKSELIFYPLELLNTLESHFLKSVKIAKITKLLKFVGVNVR